MAAVVHDQLLGVLLCWAGDVRVAVPAGHVTSIEPCEANAAVPTVRSLFRLPAVPGRRLMGPDGAQVAVDSVEVWGEPLPILPPPSLLLGGAGGSLAGFVRVKDGLWPVFRLFELARFVEQKAGGSA